MSGVCRMEVVSFLFDFALVTMSTLVTISATRRIISTNIESVQDYVICIFFVFNCMPVLLDYLFGVPQFKYLYWWRPLNHPMVDDVTRNILEKTFGPGLVDAYGSDETGSCIIKRPGNDYYDICNDTHVVNIYDDQNHLADTGKVIITPLYKTDFPIINYDIGDIASSYVKDGIRYVTKIHGRLNDMVKHENGEDTSVLELRKIPNGITGIAQFRYVQESYHDLRVELVRDPQDMTYTNEEITSFFLQRLTQLYGDEFKIDIRWLDVIPPDPNGKLRCFVCNVKE